MSNKEKHNKYETVPPSKSQRNKGRHHKAPRAFGPLTCSKCGQTCSTATANTPHMGCGDYADFWSILRIHPTGKPLLHKYAPFGHGVWQDIGTHTLLRSEIVIALSRIKNFDSKIMHWTNGLGQPIDFETMELVDFVPPKPPEVVESESKQVFAEAA